MTREYVIEVDDIDLNLVKEIYLEDVKAFFKINGELVKCKDCDYWVCPNTCGLEVITRYENDFCSRAERKEDEQN